MPRIPTAPITPAATTPVGLEAPPLLELELALLELAPAPVALLVKVVALVVALLRPLLLDLLAMVVEFEYPVLVDFAERTMDEPVPTAAPEVVSPAEMAWAWREAS